MIPTTRHWVAAVGIAAAMHLALVVWWVAPPSRVIGDLRAGEAGLQKITLLPAQPPRVSAPVPASPTRPAPPRPVAATQPSTRAVQPVRPAPEAATRSTPSPVQHQVPLPARTEAVTGMAAAQPRASSPAAEAGDSESPAETTVTAGPTSTPAASGAPALARKRYLAELAAWLERYKHYPRRAQRRRQEGTVELTFVINRAGQVVRYEIVRSSGHDLLDDAVRRMIERAQPLPALPEGLAGSSIALTLPVGFHLR